MSDEEIYFLEQEYFWELEQQLIEKQNIDYINELFQLAAEEDKNLQEEEYYES